MLKWIVIIATIILVVKYWKQVRDVSALILATMTAVLFVFTMYIHHLISTWLMLKKKK